jgi:hypothetical protein
MTSDVTTVLWTEYPLGSRRPRTRRGSDVEAGRDKDIGRPKRPGRRGLVRCGRCGRPPLFFGERTVRIPLYTPPSPRSEPGDPRTMGPWDAQVLGPRDPARGRRFRGPSEVLRSPRAEPATTPRPPVPRPTTRLPFDRRPPMVPHRAPGVHPVPRLDTGTRAGARNIGPRA